MTLVSDNIRFMRIFAGVPSTGGVKLQCGCRKQQLSVLSLTISLFLQSFRVKANIISYIILFSSLLPFH